ncbi:hypothetical protein Xmau_03744 [Xenorhabdus mauleonii]|uniref:Integrating conjugative element protein, PFL_4695 family n=1 Tax=Xenorhabdus mauleonii TaxID=351675 RepID=A0A1I3YYA6_9GAMM|nr:integrating conjugative element protein [Xenorhabdus mauleonii]PHM37782.1 hypothetical protein Xmau_03744 [Xenorhabdus mauleonii]SFK36166.1 integrating conjugative element protein, PFL_4695 family [Xenorhabdus mauleonii]
MADHLMMKPLNLFPVVGLLWMSACHAELNVIADLGGKDASPFYDSINAEQHDVSLPSAPPFSPDVEGEAAMLPVSTPELSPGKITSRSLQLPGIGALFLIGDDPDSHQWLSQNATTLTKQQAVGLVVNVRDMTGLQALRALVPGLLLSPASGTELARRLQLQHYPVLITDTRLSQQLSP